MAIADPDLDEALHAGLGVLHRRIPEDQLRKFGGDAAEIFRAFGMDLDTPATRETPRRFIRALYVVTAGYDGADQGVPD